MSMNKDIYFLTGGAQVTWQLDLYRQESRVIPGNSNSNYQAQGERPRYILTDIVQC